MVATGLLLGWLVVTMFLWGFAFYQAPESSPEWLTRAQAVCFGTTETGLPDTYGWTVLILAPLSFLAAILVVLSAEIRAGIRQLLSPAIGKAIALLLVGAILAEAVWISDRIQNGFQVARASFSPTLVGDLPPEYPRTTKPAPEFELVDQSGETISLSTLDGKATILTFAFAHCKTVCPALVTSTRASLQDLPKDRTTLLIVTLDPWRDTPSALPSLAKKWKLPENAHVLSGEVEQVNEVIQKFDIPTTRNTTNGDVTHPALVYVLAPDGTIAYTFNNPTPRWLHGAVTGVLADS